MLRFLSRSPRPIFVCFLVLLAAKYFGVKPVAAVAEEFEKPIARVFVLAGQSNMVGHGVVDLDDAKDYNGGKGTLVDVIANAKNKQRYVHLRDADGNWITRADVFIRYETPRGQLKRGGLSIGYTDYDGDPHHFGPEFQFGHVIGDAFDEPVLLIKTAWGGKSLNKDFRPPSSGGETGRYYSLMLEQIAAGMKNAAVDFPSLSDHQLMLSGVVWQQGWNDMIDETATAEYESNCLNLIRDLQEHFNVPELPFVIGELGNGGESNLSSQMKSFRASQAAIDDHGDRNVVFVPTAAFARPAQQSPNTTHLHHWFGNAESYFLVGDALGKSMVSLIKDKGKPRVLILGDSISMGYTPFVKKLLSGEAVVIRPAENCAGTDKGVVQIDRWLKLNGGNWDVIHFNWGLHDLKHVDATTGKNSNDSSDPCQTPPDEYEQQLRAIIKKLKRTGATLICATTTPVPLGCKPARETDSPQKYNAIATKIAVENEMLINDLFALVEPKLNEVQRPANVHFNRQGSELMAKQVANLIRESIPKHVGAK